MIDNGEIDKKGGLKIGGYNIIDSTLEAKIKHKVVQYKKVNLMLLEKKGLKL
jgi:hypothetical protein